MKDGGSRRRRVGARLDANESSPTAAAGRKPRPTAAELEAAVGATLTDVLGDGLDVVFCGINPGRYSGAVGHHFANPGNRFWTALHRSGFTDEVVSPFDDATLVRQGLGLTNLVERTTAAAAELSVAELRAGAQRLAGKVERFAPAFVAVLGLQAYRTAFDRPAATLGLQGDTIGRTRLWLVPNPSGLQAYYPLDAIVACLAELQAMARLDPRR